MLEMIKTHIPQLSGAEVAFFNGRAKQMQDSSMQITQVGDMPFHPFGSADYQYINPFKHLEDAPHCRTLRRLAHLIGNALVASLQPAAQFVLCQSIP